jgi:predicted unusual protein kinase regulating ubiquinone biosynthesis (AarF/ABC1/UbiB family)
VAIKVQRPDVIRSVVRDMYILRLGVSILWTFRPSLPEITI